MLSFDSGLSNALKLSNTTAFWVLKLYYNDDTVSSNYIGVSDIDRTDSSDFYHGLVSSWGAYSQSLDFFNFTTSIGNMSVKLVNTDKSIQGGRFSDLFSTKNFANRKWELFLNTSTTSTYDTSARMIGTGIISGDIKYDELSIGFKLLDNTSSYHKQLPTSTVDSTTYPNAPEKNINKPIPMAYGNFHNRTDIGTIPTSPKFDYFFTYGKFPAIITNAMNETDGFVYANGDSETLHTVTDDNIYLYNDGHYGACDDRNASVNNPQLKYNGTDWFVYIPMFSEQDNMVDSNFNSSYELNAPSAGSASAKISIPEVPILGTITKVDIILDYGVYDFTSMLDYTIFGVTAYTGMTPKTTVTIQTGGDWDFDQSGVIRIQDDSGGGGTTLVVKEMGVRVSFKPNKLFETTITETYEFFPNAGIEVSQDEEGDAFSVAQVRTRTKTFNTPSITDYIYFAGKGRKYGSWISDGGRSVGYTTTDFIENPIFIIEDILRTELSLTDTEIDESSFDISGNKTNGYIGDIYNDAVRDIKFAFSQIKFIDSKELIKRLCKQAFSWVYLSGDGKFKIKTLRQPDDYSGSDKTIDYNKINLSSISRTALGAVRNEIAINYNKDYGQDQFLGHYSTTVDATSSGTGVDGYNQDLSLEMDADTLDTPTATQLANAYQTIMKDRKVVLNFTTTTPEYNDLEIGDIIDFKNWDTNIKLYGDAMGSDYFMVSSIQKKVKTCTIKAIKVS